MTHLFSRSDWPNWSKNSNSFALHRIFRRLTWMQIWRALCRQMQFLRRTFRCEPLSFSAERLDAITIKSLNRWFLAFFDRKEWNFRKNKSTFALFCRKRTRRALSCHYMLPSCQYYAPVFTLLDRSCIEFDIASETRI